MDMLNKYVNKLFEENIRSLKQLVRAADKAYILAAAEHGQRAVLTRSRLGHRTSRRKYLAQVEELYAEFSQKADTSTRPQVLRGDVKRSK